MKFRQHFGYDEKQASDAATIPASEQGESMTIQSQTEDADINVMISRFIKTGELPQNARPPQYGDFIEISDYRSALHAVLEAQDNFMLLDPKIRARFDNDPQQFLEFAENPSNIDELRKMGLAKEKANAGDNQGGTRGAGEATGGSASATGGSSGTN